MAQQQYSHSLPIHSRYIRGNVLFHIPGHTFPFCGSHMCVHHRRRHCGSYRTLFPFTKHLPINVKRLSCPKLLLYMSTRIFVISIHIQWSGPWICVFLGAFLLIAAVSIYGQPTIPKLYANQDVEFWVTYPLFDRNESLLLSIRVSTDLFTRRVVDTRSPQKINHFNWFIMSR